MHQKEIMSCQVIYFENGSRLFSDFSSIESYRSRKVTLQQRFFNILFSDADNSDRLASHRVIGRCIKHLHYKGAYSFFQDYPGAQLVEPYKETRITLHGPLALSDANYRFLWSIESFEDTVFEGSEISLTVQSTVSPTLAVKVHVFSADSQYLSTYRSTLIVK